MTVLFNKAGRVEAREVRDGGWFVMGFTRTGRCWFDAFAGHHSEKSGVALGRFSNEAAAEAAIKGANA